MNSDGSTTNSFAGERLDLFVSLRGEFLAEFVGLVHAPVFAIFENGFVAKSTGQIAGVQLHGGSLGVGCCFDGSIVAGLRGRATPSW